MIGIELCQEAVEDAKVNATLNGKESNKVKIPPAVRVSSVADHLDITDSSEYLFHIFSVQH